MNTQTIDDNGLEAELSKAAEEMSLSFLVDLINEKGKIEFDESPQIFIRPLDFEDSLMVGDLMGGCDVDDDPDICGMYSVLIGGSSAVDLMKRLLPHLDEQLQADIETVLENWGEHEEK